MFDSLTNPKWQHSKPAVRIAAIDELDDQAILVNLVSTDPDEAVRAHALSRISDVGELDKLADTLPAGPLQQQARAMRLDQLLPDSSALGSIKDDTLLVRIASLAEDEDLVTASINQLGSAEVRMDVAVNHPVAKVRLCAVQGIDDVSLLREVMLQARHKDKSVFRYCKERVDRQHAEERAEAERQERIERLIEDAGSLSKTVDSPEYTARYQTLQHRWEQLKEHANPLQLEQIQKDMGICADRVEEKTRSIADEEQKQAQVEAARLDFPLIIAELEGLDPTDAVSGGPESIKALTDRLNELEDRWLAASRHAQADKEQTKACKKRLKHWRRVAQTLQGLQDRKSALSSLREKSAKVEKADFIAVQKLHGKTSEFIKKFAWPESLDSIRPKALVKLHKQNLKLEEQLARLNQEARKNLEHTEVLFEKLRKELEDAHYRNADKAHNKLKNLIRKLSPDRQQHFNRELAPLTARLREIHDWQGFAIEPKKVELCERMQALVGSDEDPNALAVKIRALQADWKKLGPLPRRRDQALWNEFHNAAEKAYEPCKRAFAEQAVLRRENFKRRMGLVAQLTDYEQKMAWPDAQDLEPGSASPDWKMVQKTLDTAREAFNAIKPVDRKGERKSRKALKTVCDRIYGHIKAEYERNIERKKELLSQAKALVESDDLAEAIQQAKSIQREWKAVGITPVQVDRRLWKDFRKACDGVFARLDEQREQRNAESRARAEQAELRKRKLQERWPRLLNKMRACGLKADDAEKASELWGEGDDLPRGIDSAALETWWKEGVDDGISEDSLREACIALEIHLEQDSPPEDKEARMAYQMKRLVEGMGSRQADNTERRLQLVNEFIAMRPPAQWADRFCLSLQQSSNKR